jgi:hypothetical protein
MVWNYIWCFELSAVRIELINNIRCMFVNVLIILLWIGFEM